MDICRPVDARTASAVMIYLRSHPDAGDSADGIRAWWLRERKRDLPETVLKEILADLATQGLIELRRDPSGRMLYRARPKRT